MRLAALLVVAGCAHPSAPATPPPTVANAGLDDGGFAVRILDPGREPRRTLRYDLHLAQYLSIVLLTQIATNLVMVDPVAGKVVRDSDTPTIREILGVEVKAKLPDGSVRLAWKLEATSVLDDVPLEAKQRANLETTRAALVGMHGEARLNPRGVMSEATFDLPPGAPASVASLLEAMRDALTKMYVPLPVDPVGLGATWEVASGFPMMGAKVATTWRDHLVALDASSARWEMTVTMTARDQPIATSGMTGMLHTLTGKGHGEVGWSPHQMMPLGRVQMITDGAFSLGSGGQALEATMHSTVDVASRPSH